MPTLLDIKNFVTGQLGADEGSLNDTIRDRLINDARRKYYSERRWSFLETAYQPSWTPSGSFYTAAMPAGWNPKFKPVLQEASGGIDIEYRLVPYAGLNDRKYCYAVSGDTVTVSRIVSAGPAITYWVLPADASLTGSDNAVEEPAPDITALSYYALASWWLSSERNRGNYLLFMDMYREQRTLDVAADSSSAVLSLDVGASGIGQDSGGGYGSGYRSLAR